MGNNPNLLFAALSLVSSFSKGSKDGSDLHGMEIEKNTETLIEGTYTNYNSMMGLDVKNGGNEDYFYALCLGPGGKVYNASGSEVPFSTIREGDKLKVSYDGTVELVYPPKLNNVSKIEIVNNVVEEKKD